MPNRYAGDPLPAADGEIGVERVQFDQPTDSAGPFCRDHSGAAAAERVENDAVAATAITD